MKKQTIEQQRQILLKDRTILLNKQTESGVDYSGTLKLIDMQLKELEE